MFSDAKDVIKLLKAVESMVFKTNSKCDIYIAMQSIVNRVWHFFQERDMSNIVYINKFKNLIEVAEKHGAKIELHPELLGKEAADPTVPTDDEIEVTKGFLFGRIFVIKACQY
eukprot:14989502-Ditylum_brightwellii.AAC.1